MTRALLLALALAAAACSTPPSSASPRPPPPEPPAAPPAKATPPAPEEPPPAAPAGGGANPCADLTARYDAALKASANACAADADCTCYPDLRMDGRLNVADKATAKTLTSLSNDYRKLKCPTMFMSTAGPPVCGARCKAGHCQ